MASPASTPPRKPSILCRSLTWLVLGLLLAFIGVNLQVLWREYGNLQREQHAVSASVVIGFHNVAVNPSFARKPDDWIHDEAESTLLWSNWERGVGHRWFRFDRGDLAKARITGAWGRDTVQAIDYPIVEIGGGAIWGRMPDGTEVVSQEFAGVRSIYPILLLDKVEIVNDAIGDQPYLVTYNPFGPRRESVTIYDPRLEGRRLTMGMTGYFHDRKPLLYDRGTESLWVDEAGTLRAIAGPKKGASLRGLGRATLAPWSECRSAFPHGRLIVGADRSRPKPEL